MQQYSFHGCYRERMANERPCKEGYANFGEGFIPELPHAAVEGIHEACFTRQDTDGHAACDDLSVGCEISADSKQRLASALVYAKSGNDFIKNERRAGCLGNPANRFQEFDGLKGRMATLNRLHDHSGKFTRVLA